MRNLASTGLWASGLAASLLVFACSSDTANSTPPGADASTDSSSGGGGTGGKGTGGAGTGGKSTGGGGSTGSGGTAPDAAANPDASLTAPPAYCAGKTGAALVACGKYIVDSIAACADCHSPRLATGALDMSKALAGNPSLADIAPTTAGVGNIPTPNLTQLAAQGWTAADVMDAVLNGKRSAARGGDMFPIMPYFTLHNMAHDDAAAIAAYILQLTPIANTIPAREPLPSPLDKIPFRAPPVPYSMLPDPQLPATDRNYTEAMRGKYLATTLGPCMECHTPQKPITNAIDMSKFFAGGRDFDIGPPIGVVTSLNITPDSTGIRGWTPVMVKTAIKQGLDDANKHLCPPMPFGPMGAFGGMTDTDALAIGLYITNLKPIANGPAGGGPFLMKECAPPPLSDAGPRDAATGG
jgi:cytochrome c553